MESNKVGITDQVAEQLQPNCIALVKSKEPGRFILRCPSCCFYCGQFRTGYDHFPPKSKYPFGYLLPCCEQGNKIVGICFPFQLSKRVLYLKNKLREYSMIDSRISWNPQKFFTPYYEQIEEHVNFMNPTSFLFDN